MVTLAGMSTTNERVEQTAEKAGELYRAFAYRQTDAFLIMCGNGCMTIIVVTPQEVAPLIESFFIREAAFKDNSVFIAQVGVCDYRAAGPDF